MNSTFEKSIGSLTCGMRSPLNPRVSRAFRIFALSSFLELWQIKTVPELAFHPALRRCNP